FFAVMVGILVFANWGAPNDFVFKLKDGREFHGAVIKSPEDASAPGAAFGILVLDGSSAGQEIFVQNAEISVRTPAPGLWSGVWKRKWLITSLFGLAFGTILILWFNIRWWKIAGAVAFPAILSLLVPSGGLWILLPFSAAVVGFSIIAAREEGEASDWFAESWGFAKQITPLLLFGVLIAGFLLARPGHEGLIPSKYIEMLVGEEPGTFLSITGLQGSRFEPVVSSMWPLWTNLFASVFGAFMYFATLTEVPILQGLIGSGMGKGPALALLLAGPALSLPSMLVIQSIMGTKKTAVFCSLVVIMAALSGMIFGAL
ncbi:MAG TPA: permease, partial [Oligoflexia bacterium]|nr:permease [Oligoflexia bacterium]